jgi:hypothetical protein
MVTAFIADEQIVENLKGAGVALTGDIKTWVKDEALADYLKTNDLKGAIEALEVYLPADKVQEIADDARDKAKAAAAEDIKKAIAEYDKALAASFDELFNQLEKAEEEAEGDDDAEEEAPTKAKQAISKLADLLKGSINLSEEAAEEVNVLRIQLASKLTSLVFYPEVYYGGIEAIEISALHLENIYEPKSTEEGVYGTAQEQFKEIPESYTGQFAMYPNGYAKYHINPQNANLDGYTLSFIDHTAQTRAASSPYLEPVEADASKYVKDPENGGYGIYDDVLWVEFKNDAETFNAINKATRVPSFAHNAPYIVGYKESEGTEGEDAEAIYYDPNSHYSYGAGKTSGQGIITALTATNVDEEGDASYVASDYALIVPVEIKNLIIANNQFSQINEFEESDLDADAFKEYDTWENCVATHKFHLHRKAIERIGDDEAIIELRYDQQFNLKDYVETHFMTVGAGDDKMSDDMFRRLNLDYRFFPIDYTTKDKYIANSVTEENWDSYQLNTHHSLYMTLTGKDENGDFNGIGYFNNVKDNKEKNGEKVKGENPFGGEYELANKSAVGRQPVVRVELFRKDDPETVYAIGYLKLEISEKNTKPAENFTIQSTEKLFASCYVSNGRVPYDELDTENATISRCSDCNDGDNLIILRWDQIADQLRQRIVNPETGKAEGLTPAEWNAYDLADNYQYILDDNGEFVKIVPGKTVYSAETPYYQIGTLAKLDDQDWTSSASGVWTDVLVWQLCPNDYQAIYFDMQYRNKIIKDGDKSRKGIDAATGILTEPITRYVKLSSNDSSKPDLYVGITIAANSIRFPAGTVGKVKGAYWKQAAVNTAGDNDMVLNVELGVVTGKAQADENDAWKNNVQKGKFSNNLIDNFFGEDITVAFNYANLDGTTELEGDELAAAKKAFANHKDDYADADFFFRAPRSSGKEAVMNVTKNGLWDVFGISEHKQKTYTLMVTDRVYELASLNKEAIKMWTSFGYSVSVVGINGVTFEEMFDEADDLDDVKGAQLALALGLIDDIKTYAADATIEEKLEALIQEIPVGGLTKQYNKLTDDVETVKGIRVMTLDTDSKIDLLTGLAEPTINADGEVTKWTVTENDIVKGITQDMLNYAFHNEGANGAADNVDRPYNKQLTAFVELVAENEGLINVPCGFKMSSDKEGTSGPDPNSCVILPGFGQSETCTYCTGSVAENVLLKFSGDECFKPIVENKKFAVRFYQPVHIWGSGEGKITDAKLVNNVAEIGIGSVISFQDWADYTPGTNFTNFLKYYGVSVKLPDVFDESKYKKVVEAELAKEGIVAQDRPTNPVETVGADKVKLFAGTETDPDKVYTKATETPANTGDRPEQDPNDAPTEPSVPRPGSAPELYDVPTYSVQNVKLDAATNNITTEAFTEETVFNTGDEMLSETDGGKPALSDTDGKPYGITLADFLDANDNPTAKKTMAEATGSKADEPKWKEENGKFWFTFTEASGDAFKSPVQFTSEYKAEILAIIAETTVNNFAEKLAGITVNYIKDAYTRWFQNQKDYAAYLAKYNQAARIYNYYVADAKAWTEFFVGEPLEATQEVIADVFDGNTTYDSSQKWYVVSGKTNDDVTALADLTTDASKAATKPGTSKAEQNAQKQAEYDAAKAAWDAYDLALELYNAGGLTWDKQDAAKKYRDAYTALYGTGKEFATYADALAAWTEENTEYTAAYKAMDAKLGGFANGWKSVVYTDLDVVGGAAARKITHNNAEIESMYTVAESAPEKLNITIAWGDNVTDGAKKYGNVNCPYTGSLKVTYQNNKFNTDEAFHIYIPLEVTYYYQNKKPAAPQIVYAAVTINATTGNATTGARRK